MYFLKYKYKYIYMTYNIYMNLYFNVLYYKYISQIWVAIKIFCVYMYVYVWYLANWLIHSARNCAFRCLIF